MDVFLQNIFVFPTAIFTLLIGVMGVYWVFVIMGVVDLEIFDAADGAIDAGADGLLEAVDGMDAVDGIDGVDASTDGLLESIASVGDIPLTLLADSAPSAVLQGTFDKVLDKESISELVSSVDEKRQGLSLRVVPLSISLSLVLVFGWMFSYLATQFAGTLLPTDNIISGGIIVFGSVTLASVITSILIRPFGGTFVTHEGQSNRDLIGESAEVISPSVDSIRGEIRVVNKSGVPLQLQARYDREYTFERGEEVLVIHFDKARNVCIVEPMSSPLGRAIGLRKEQLRQLHGSDR